MTTTITYKGRRIEFNEDTETWRCEELNIAPKPKLKTVKAEIDRASAEERRLDLEVLHLASADWLSRERKIQKVKAVLLCAPEDDYETKQPRIKQCWIVDEKGERSKAHLYALYPLEAEGALAVWIEMKREAEEASKGADNFLKSIAQHSAESLLATTKKEAPAE